MYKYIYICTTYGRAYLLTRCRLRMDRFRVNGPVAAYLQVFSRRPFIGRLVVIRDFVAVVVWFPTKCNAVATTVLIRWPEPSRAEFDRDAQWRLRRYKSCSTRLDSWRTRIIVLRQHRDFARLKLCDPFNDPSPIRCFRCFITSDHLAAVVWWSLIIASSNVIPRNNGFKRLAQRG